MRFLKGASLNDHPSREELVSLIRGVLPAEREGFVMKHLLSSCAICFAEVPALKVLLGAESFRKQPTEQEVDAYSAPVASVLEIVRKHEHHLRLERKAEKKYLALLESDGLKALDKIHPKQHGLGLFEALLKRSWVVRRDNPGLMIQLTLLATLVARNLNVRRYGLKLVADFQCRAWADLGNAYRVADQLDSAQGALRHASELFELGTGDKTLGIKLLDLEASLAADRRQFGLACNAMSLIYKYHNRLGDRHLAGRALISKGLYIGYWGQPEEAIKLLRKGLSLIDEKLDPDLALSAVHNELWFLVDCGKFEEAKKRLFLNRGRCRISVGRVSQLKIEWLEARIDVGHGKLDRAVKNFFQAKQGFSEVGRPFDSALVSLDLAAVLMVLKRPGEAEELVVEAARVFSAMRIEREALMAVLMLKRSFEMRQASAELVEEVAAFVRRSENDPNARFDPKPR
jgi:tetratricopeptide (TPR) repeat protein